MIKGKGNDIGNHRDKGKGQMQAKARASQAMDGLQDANRVFLWPRFGLGGIKTITTGLWDGVFARMMGLLFGDRFVYRIVSPW